MDGLTKEEAAEEAVEGDVSIAEEVVEGDVSVAEEAARGIGRVLEGAGWYSPARRSASDAERPGHESQIATCRDTCVWSMG